MESLFGTPSGSTEGEQKTSSRGQEKERSRGNSKRGKKFAFHKIPPKEGIVPSEKRDTQKGYLCKLGKDRNQITKKKERG